MVKKIYIYTHEQVKLLSTKVKLTAIAEVSKSLPTELDHPLLPEADAPAVVIAAGPPVNPSEDNGRSQAGA
ncbi:hypothetical protein AXF42_Ash000394 [Apostasia shenzhenica]|uniref:Uncharacterized protein n=1 Tax=Apostasia shenzhenica TaxID=1088818 RepID=A0A2I0AG56_9ASPA|nr:hypothetical protein AXF42_Ash000394 [Apostasia shenzhenica]